MTLDEKVFNLIKLICESKIVDDTKPLDSIISIRTKNNGDFWFFDILVENFNLVSFTETNDNKINFIYCNKIDILNDKAIFETSYFHHVLIYGKEYFKNLSYTIPAVILCDYYDNIINYILTNFERIENV